MKKGTLELFICDIDEKTPFKEAIAILRNLICDDIIKISNEYGKCFFDNLIPGIYELIISNTNRKDNIYPAINIVNGSKANFKIGEIINEKK